MPFIFLTASPGWEAGEIQTAATEQRGRNCRSDPGPTLGGFCLKHNFNRAVNINTDSQSLFRGLKESSFGNRKCISKGKARAQGGFPGCTSPFLGCKEQQGSDYKAFICKITANKSKSNNTLPPTARSLGGGEMKESCRSDQQAGAWQEIFTPKLFGKSSSL